MSRSVLVALVGEQPMPVLLPILHLKPAASLLAHTERTRPVAENVQRLIAAKSDLSTKIELCQVDPYDIHRVRAALQNCLQAKGWSPEQLLYNLTGGTKTMILAGYELACSTSASYFYLESERGKSVLYHYRLENGSSVLAEKPAPLPGLITIQDYLHAHGFFEFREGRDPSGFFQAVWQEVRALENNVLDEALPSIDLYGSGQVDIDIAMRHENRVAIAEVKSGNRVNSMEWIKQLNTAARQTTLGTYTKRLAIVDRKPESHYREIAGLQDIEVVALEGFRDHPLGDADRALLRDAVARAFGMGG